MGLETEPELAIECFKIARQRGIPTLLNVSPPDRICQELFELSDVVIMNQSEQQQMLAKLRLDENKTTGHANQTLVITHGKNGVEVVKSEKACLYPAFAVKDVLDTTGAGDCFLGGLIVQLTQEPSDFDAAIQFGQKVAALKIRQKGAWLQDCNYHFVKNYRFD